MSKAEQEFLSAEDYGHLLPKGYRTPEKKWITFYKINMGTFVLFLLITFIYAVFIEGWLLPIGMLVVGLALTWFNMREQEKSAQRHFQELFKDKTPDMKVTGNPGGLQVN